MSHLEADLAAHYDQDAPHRAARPLDPERARRRTEFARLLQVEGRRRVVEVGTGPGTDGAGLQADGLLVSGVDLSPENVARCGAAGVDAHVASALALPFEDGSFDAGWTMSTLLHIPDGSLDDALHELRRVLVPGAPVAIGVWAGDDTEGVLAHDRFDPPRFFSFRSDERLQRMLGRHGAVERFDTWQVAGATPSAYQWAVLRVT